MGQTSLDQKELIPIFKKAKEKFLDFPDVLEKIENLIQDLQNKSDVSVDNIMVVVDAMNDVYKENFVNQLDLSGDRNKIICSILNKIGFGFLVRKKGD